MTSLKKRFVTAVANEEGDFGIQQLVLIAVALAIGFVMFRFGGSIMDFITGKQENLSDMDEGGISINDRPKM